MLIWYQLQHDGDTVGQLEVVVVARAIPQVTLSWPTGYWGTVHQQIAGLFSSVAANVDAVTKTKGRKVRHTLFQFTFFCRELTNVLLRVALFCDPP